MKEYDLPWTDLALSSRVKHEQHNVYVMEPNLELVTLYTRIGLKFSFKDFIKVLLGKYRLNSSTQKEIDWLKKRIDWGAVEKLIDIYYGQNGKAILELMQKPLLTTRDVLKLRNTCESNFLKYSRCKKGMRLKEFKNYLIINYVNKWRHKHSLTFVTRKVPFSKQGITIAFLGQDGAGKTTVTTDIRKWLSWKLDVRYSYLGSGDNYHSFTKHVTHCIPPFPPFGLFKKMVLALFYNNLAKDVLSLIIKGNQYAENGGIQIFDRYPQGCYPGINDGPKIRTEILPQIGWLSKSLMFLAEKEEKVINTAFAHNPNIVFKLLLPPEESIRRKPENDINIIRKKHEVIKNLSFPESDVYIIDAAQPYNDEILQIKEIIWQHIQK